jgi:ribosomal protein S20
MAVTALSSSNTQALIEQMKERRTALKAMEEAVRTGDIASAQKSLATLKSGASADAGGSSSSGDTTNPFRAMMKADLSTLTAAVEKGDLEGAQSALQTLDADKAKFQPPPPPPFGGDAQTSDQGGFLNDLKSLLKAVQSGDSDGVKTALASLQNDLQSFLAQADTKSDGDAAGTPASGTTTGTNSFGDDIKALMDAAASGDTKAMQDAAKKVAQGIDTAISSAGTHHAHRHAHADADDETAAAATGSTATVAPGSIASDPDQPLLPESAMLRNAREAYALLMSFGDNNTA